MILHIESKSLSEKDDSCEWKFGDISLQQCTDAGV